MIKTDEILEIANKDGFPLRFKIYKEFLKEKLSIVEDLTFRRVSAENNQNVVEMNDLDQQIDENMAIISEVEENFLEKDGKTLKLLETWVEANPK